MAEFRPELREIYAVKVYARMAEKALAQKLTETAGFYSRQAFALAHRIAARNQERTK